MNRTNHLYTRMKEGIIKRNNVRIIGKGTQPMLLAHGFGCDQHVWRHLVPEFEQDYRLILFDYVGSGQSDMAAYDRDRYNSLDGYAQDIIDICDALELSNVVFVGHSVSSMIGLLASIQQPDYFDRLVMIGPSPRYLNDKPDYIGGFEKADIDELLELMELNFIRWANTMAPAIMGHPDQPELGQELTQSFCSTDTDVMLQFGRVTFLADNRQDLPKSLVPSLVLQCDQDIIAPLVVGDYLHKHLPNSTLRYLKATGHCPHLSTPAEIVTQMKDYLSVAQLN